MKRYRFSTANRPIFFRKPPFPSRKLFISFGILALGLLTALTFWLIRLDKQLTEQFSEGLFGHPLEFYAQALTLEPGETIPLEDLLFVFEDYNFRQREFGQFLRPNDYSVWGAHQCHALFGETLPKEKIESLESCVLFHPQSSKTHNRNREPEDDFIIIAQNNKGLIIALAEGPTARPLLRTNLPAQLVAHSYGQSPILREPVPFSSVPLHCSQAVLAIEDARFLDHRGISYPSLVRAMLANLQAGRIRQGGSTISQQLIKNSLLTHERTLRRKITEFFLSYILEYRVEKEKILESYLNIIYMGQNGPYEIRGLASAARAYFDKNLTDLNIPECATLAGMIQAPARIHPVRNADRAMKRRNLVLQRMEEVGFLSSSEKERAESFPLPSKTPDSPLIASPYFLQAVRQELSRLNLDLSQGLRIYTSLHPEKQSIAEQAVIEGLSNLNDVYPHLNFNKDENLQAALIVVDTRKAQVIATMGGRSFQTSPFNRAIYAKRQTGSVFKPIVYLAAIESLNRDGRKFHALSPVYDEYRTHSFDGRSWSPKNYDETYRGTVPAFFALKESLNAAAANLALEVGLPKIVHLAQKLGVRSTLRPYPSIALGSFEMTPLEVAEVYTTFSNYGMHTKLSFIERIETLDGKLVYENPSTMKRVVSEHATAQLISLLEQTFLSGTGRRARDFGWSGIAAGKTGTTNDKRDAWFVGFSANLLTVVWVGYDSGEPTHLTGSSAALPLWVQFMAEVPNNDFLPFDWPSHLRKYWLEPEEQEALGIHREKAELTYLYLPSDIAFQRARLD